MTAKKLMKLKTEILQQSLYFLKVSTFAKGKKKFPKLVIHLRKLTLPITITGCCMMYCYKSFLKRDFACLPVYISSLLSRNQVSCEVNKNLIQVFILDKPCIRVL